MIKQKQIFGCCLLLFVFSLATIPAAQADKIKIPRSLQAAGHGLTVDIYQDMESGNPGDLLTPEIMNASSHGGFNESIPAIWNIYGVTPTNPLKGVWISTANVMQLPGKVTVRGIGDFKVTSTRTWVYRDRYDDNYVLAVYGKDLNPNIPNQTHQTIACYLTLGHVNNFSRDEDVILMGSGVLQVAGNLHGPNPPYIIAHSSNWESPNAIKVIAGKTYWVNLHKDSAEGLCKVAVFDPANGYAQVGETVISQSPTTAFPSKAGFGRNDNHGNTDLLGDNCLSYFSHIMIDYTEAKFPLLPYIESSQEIPLSPGWNWISFNVLPADLSLNSVFSGILVQVEQVKGQTQSAIRIGGNWKGDLADMSGIGQNKMFKVKVTQACTLTVTGTADLSTNPIHLGGGWNWVAYLPTTSMSITTALASINGQVLQVKSLTQSATYNGTSWSGAFDMQPGQGYAIKMSAPGTLTYPGGQ
jgi:hypothetical protein